MLKSLFHISISSVVGLKRIPVCDGSLKPDSVICYLTPEEFQKKFGCEYTENLLIDKTQSEKVKARILSEKNLNGPKNITDEQVTARINKPLTCLVVCNLGGPLGHSLMTSEKIETNTVIGFYHGEIEDVYGYANKSHRSYAVTFLDGFTINSERQGGLMRFMPHLPYNKKQQKELFKSDFIKNVKKKTGIDLENERGKELLASTGNDIDAYMSELFEENIDDMEFITFTDENERDKVASANIAMEHILIGSKIFNVVYATNEIPAYTVVGFSYGENHFLHTDAPEPKLIYPDGSLVSEKSYIYKTLKNESDPQKIYQMAVKCYKESKFDLALAQLQCALTLFRKKANANQMNIATCHSTIASCYRDLSKLNFAIESCLNACITSLINNDKTKYDHYKRKLLECIEQDGGSDTAQDYFYRKAVDLFRNQQYQLSLRILEEIENSFTAQDLALCKSTMASCYRELSMISEAKEKCKEALKISSDTLGPNAGQTKKIKTKLMDIEELATSSSMRSTY